MSKKSEIQTEAVFERKFYGKMLYWKAHLADKCALLIEGARRVGKTTIAEEFGRNEYKSCITISFQSANDTIRDLFVNSLLDLDYFFIKLQILKKLTHKTSLKRNIIINIITGHLARLALWR